MTAGKPYQYRHIKQPNALLAVNRLPAPTAQPDDPNPLTGYVNGIKATNIEERFARALRQRDLHFRFQVRFPTATSLPGHERIVDFVIYYGLRYPVEVDGEMSHSTSAQLGADAVREALLNEVFRWKGMPPLRRVKWWQLETQVMADAAVSRLFG